VAVRAQQAQVFAPVVVADAVDVIEVQHEALVAPARNATPRALVAPTECEQPTHEAGAVERWTVRDEDGVIGKSLRAPDAFDAGVRVSRFAA
jgi:hypothetical protein